MYYDEEDPKRTWVDWLLIGLVVLLIACAGLGILAATKYLLDNCAG